MEVNKVPEYFINIHQREKKSSVINGRISSEHNFMNRNSQTRLTHENQCDDDRQWWRQGATEKGKKQNMDPEAHKAFTDF